MDKMSFLLAAISVCCVVGIADGALIDQGNGIIFDDENHTYWMQDMSLFSLMTYDEQLDAISALNNPGGEYTSPLWGDWHLASRSELEDMWKDPPNEEELIYTLQIQANLLEVVTIFKPARTQDGQFLYFEGRFEEVASVHPGPGHNVAILSCAADYSGWIDPSGLVKYDMGMNDSYGNGGTGAWVAANAVPEPTTAVILGLGTLFFRRRFRSKLDRY